MKHTISAFATVVCLSFLGTASSAATFTGYSETADVFYDDASTFDYDPFFLGGSIFDLANLVNISFSTDLGTGSLLLTDSSFATVLDGFLLDSALNVDDDIADDSFSMLFDLTTGPTNYTIATFTGNLDSLGSTDFFTDGVLFADGNLKIVGATQIPLPTILPLFVIGLSGLFIFARRKELIKQVDN